MYVMPSDIADIGLDTTGAIARSVAAMHKWFASQTGGPKFRFDTYQGSLDITFLRLPFTDAEVRANGNRANDQMRAQMILEGFDKPNKLYVVYYGGSMDGNFCGLGSYPPGAIAVLYLTGGQLQRTDGIPCFSTPLTFSESVSDYWEYALAHEIIHTLGFIPSCAPNVDNGHTKDSPNDLMHPSPLYTGAPQLDVGHDDYYMHSNGGCPDLADSVFLDPSVPGGVLPVDWAITTPSLLPDRSCAEEPGLKSEQQGPETTIEFKNATSKPIQVFWLNFDGERVLILTVEPWFSWGVNSFEGYPWVVADAQGNCLAVYTSGTGETRVFWTGK